MSGSNTSVWQKRVVCVARRAVLASIWALAVCISCFATTARAAGDANGDDPQLEAPIQQGIALRRAGNDEAALNLFLDLERSYPESTRVLLHVTAAAQATGRW